VIPLAHHPSLGEPLLTRVAWIAADFHTTRTADFVCSQKFLKELSHSGDVEICSKKLTFNASHQFLGVWSEMGNSSGMKKLTETATVSVSGNHVLIADLAAVTSSFS